MNPDQFQRVAATLAQMHSDVDAAECHGMLCGALSTAGVFDENAWVAHVRGDEPGTGSGGPTPETLQELVQQTRDALGRDDFSFALLLPHDEAPVSERAAAFAQWCRGYLSGLGLAGLVDVDVLGEDARGFLRDLERFCSLRADDTEDDDHALSELTEFTRMGVLIVRAELDTLRDVPPAPDALH